MSNQTKPAPPKIVVAPEGCRDHFTAGKEYEVQGIWADWDDRYGYGLFIIDDDGSKLQCLEMRCSHLNRFNWIIKEREVSHD